MKKEIETRFLEINKEEIVKKLIFLGSVDFGLKKLEDFIFEKIDENIPLANDGCVRLRKIGDEIKLTYKERINQSVDGSFETEFKVSDFPSCEIFLKKMDLKNVRKLEKWRHSFKLNDSLIDIDTWPKIPTYIEIEGPSIESVKNVSMLLGLDWEKRFDGDAREVFRHYGYDLDKISSVSFNGFEYV